MNPGSFQLFQSDDTIICGEELEYLVNALKNGTVCIKIINCLININRIAEIHQQSLVVFLANQYFDVLFTYITDEVWNSVKTILPQCLTNGDISYLISQFVRNAAILQTQVIRLGLRQKAASTITDNPFYVLLHDSTIDYSIFESISVAQCPAAIEQYILFAIGSSTSSDSLRSLIRFYLRLFSDRHHFVGLMVDTEIRLGKHPALIVNELAPYCQDSFYTYHVLRILESCIQTESLFTQLAQVLSSFLIQHKIKMSESSFLPLLSIGFSTLEKPLLIKYIAKDLISQFIQLWKSTNKGVNRWICYGFSLLQLKELTIDPDACLPSDDSAISQVLSLLENKRTAELCKLCELAQSLFISLFLCYDDYTVVQLAGETLSKRLDPYCIIFSLFVESIQIQFNTKQTKCLLSLYQHLPYCFHHDHMVKPLLRLIIPLLDDAKTACFAISLLTPCLLSVPSFHRPYWIILRSLLKRYPTEEAVHHGILNELYAIATSTSIHYDEIIPFVTHFVKMYLSSTNKPLHLPLFQILELLSSEEVIDPIPLIDQTKLLLSDDYDMNITIFDFISTAVYRRGYKQSIIRYIWECTSSSEAISAAAYETLSALPDEFIIETLPVITETDDKETLLALLVQRLWEMDKNDSSISALIKICCIVEGVSEKREKKTITSTFIKPDGYWSDENEVFNSYTTVLDLLGPIAFYVPSSDVRESAAASYKSFIRHILSIPSVLSLNSLTFVDYSLYVSVLGKAARSFLNHCESAFIESDWDEVITILDRFTANPNALWLLLFILETQPQRLSESIYNRLVSIPPTSPSFQTMLVYFSVLLRWNEQRVYNYYKSIHCDSESSWVAWMLGVSKLICDGTLSSRISFLHVIMKASYHILKPHISTFSSRSGLDSKILLLDQTPSVAFPSIEATSPFFLSCLSSLFASAAGIQQLIPSLTPLIFSLACEFTKPQQDESLRVFGFYHLSSFLCSLPLDNKAQLRGRTLLLNGANYESKLNRSIICTMMCNLALIQYKNDKQCEDMMRKNIGMNKKWLISSVSKVKEYSITWRDMCKENKPEFQTIILFQYNQLIGTSKSSDNNPLLSLPSNSLIRQFWHHFYQQLRQDNSISDPIALQALVTSLRLNRLPSSGDLKSVCELILDTCLKEKWWELLEMGLETSEEVLQKPGVLMDYLIHQVLQRPEIDSLCVILKKYSLFVGQSRHDLFSSFMKKVSEYLQNSTPQEKQKIVDCFISYPSTLPSYVNVELERIMPYLGNVNVSSMLNCLSESCLMSLLPVKTEDALHELSLRNDLNVWNICKATMAINAPRLVWCNLLSIVRKQKDRSIDKFLELMINELYNCSDTEFCFFVETATACLDSYLF